MRFGPSVGLALLLALLLAGCSCDGAGSLRVSGETPFVRCWADDAGDVQLPGSTWDPDARSLVMGDTGGAVPIAAFAGPGDADPRAALAAVRRARPRLVLVLGDLGTTEAVARRNVEALEALEIPTLFVAGGADLHPVIAAALEESERVIDASRIRRVRIGRVELVPVAGAPGGRYAIGADACGFTEEDVNRIADETGDLEEGIARYLVSWAAPSPAPAMGEVDAGSTLVARIAEAVSARGAVHAWPRELDSDRERIALRPIAGPWVALGEGARARPGVTILRVSQNRLSLDDSP